MNFKLLCVVDRLLTSAQRQQQLVIAHRAAVGQLIAMPAFVDVIIPRGGKGLIERISRDDAAARTGGGGTGGGGRAPDPVYGDEEPF